MILLPTKNWVSPIYCDTLFVSVQQYFFKDSVNILPGAFFQEFPIANLVFSTFFSIPHQIKTRLLHYFDSAESYKIVFWEDNNSNF